MFAQVDGKVVGHEAIGRVEFKGEDVTNVDVDDIVGLRYIRSTCLECSYCLSGQDNLCPSQKTFADNIGSLSNASMWDSRYVHKIPESIKPRYTGPLMCAGSSVFGALYGYNISPTATVGIVGLGGLGHLAILLRRLGDAKVSFEFFACIVSSLFDYFLINVHCWFTASGSDVLIVQSCQKP